MKRWPAFWIAPPCCRISNPNPEYPPQLKTVRFFSGRLGRCTRTLFYGGVFSEIYLDLQKVGPDGCCRIFRPLFRGASSDGSGRCNDTKRDKRLWRRLYYRTCVQSTELPQWTGLPDIRLEGALSASGSRSHELVESRTA